MSRTHLEVFIGRVNPENLVKPIQKTQKKWVGLGNLVDMVSKNGKPIKINGFRIKPDQTQKTHLPNNSNIFYLHRVEESYISKHTHCTLYLNHTRVTN